MEGNEKITKKLIEIFEKEIDSSKKTSSQQPKETAEENKEEQTPTVDYSQPGPSSRSSSPEPNCAICLETLQNKSFTDSCFHTFCFTCLVEWSKVKPECPLCKQKFKSIVHNVQKDLTFEEYHISSRNTNDRIPVFEQWGERFRYRTTRMVPYRTTQSIQPHLTLENLNRDLMMSHRMMFAPHTVRVPPASSLQFLSRHSQPLQFRKRVYTEGLWVKKVPLRQVRLVSADFFRRNPACMHRLIPWLQRELEVLLPYHRASQTHLLNQILALLPQNEINSEAFAHAVRFYLGARTSHFVHEFLNFAVSPHDMDVYDVTAEYSFLPSTHPAQPLIIPGEDHEDDDDVRPLYPHSAEGRDVMALDMSLHRTSDERRKRMPLSLYLRKRSENNWVSSTLANPGPSQFNPTTPSSSAVPSDDDECQVVGVVKPKSERTPEIVDLSSDDETTTAGVIDISGEFSYSSCSPETSDWRFSPPPSRYSPVLPFSSPRYTPVSPGYSPVSPRYSDSTPEFPDTPRFILYPDSDVECVYEGKRETSPFSPQSPVGSPSTPSTSRTCDASTSAAPSSSEKRPKLASAIVMPKTTKTSWKHRPSNSEDTCSSDGSPKKKVKKLKLCSIGVIPSSSAHHSSEPSRDSSSRRSSSSYKLTVAFKKHKKKKHKEKKKHVHKHKRRLLTDSDSD